MLAPTMTLALHINPCVPSGDCVVRLWNILRSSSEAILERMDGKHHTEPGAVCMGLRASVVGVLHST